MNRIQLYLRRSEELKSLDAYTGLRDELAVFLGWQHPSLGVTSSQLSLGNARSSVAKGDLHVPGPL